MSHLKFYLYCGRKDEAQRHVELIKINHGEPASERRRSYEIKDQRLRNAASCWLGVFRFWTFLKSSCFRSLYDALDLKNNYCAKKIRKFYLLAIAHGG